MKKMYLVAFQLAVCIAINMFCISAYAAQSEYSLTDGSSVRLLGRGMILSDGESRTFNWPNAGFEFVFEGMEASVFVSEFNLAESERDRGNYFSTAVYDESDNLIRRERISMNEGWNLFYKYKPGDPKVKKIKFVRSSEVYYGSLAMNKIKADAKVLPSKGREVLIESVGDSYTAGCGVLANAGSEPSTAANTDNWYSYATVTARYFNADNNIVAISGNGVVTNNGYEVTDTRHKVMKEQIEYDEPRVASPTSMSKDGIWTQGLKKADLVTVWLGTNDGNSVRKTVTDEEFEEGYIELLAKAEKMHPGAKFICMAEPSNRWYSIIKNIVGAKGENYYFHSVLRKGESGGTGHPNQKEAAIVAEDLIKTICENNILQDPNERKISAFVDHNTGVVTISGKCMRGKSMIAAMVTSQNASLDSISGNDIKWCGQTQSNSNGNWSFSFKLKNEDMGSEFNYTVKSPSNGNDMSFSFKNTVPSISVKKDGVLVENIGQIKENDIIEVTASGFLTNDGKNGILIVTQYDAAGTLVAAKTKNTPSDLQSFGESATSNVEIKKDVSEVKVYYWTQESLVPLMGVYSIN